jgi:CRP/FNR family transcriptional regulator
MRDGEAAWGKPFLTRRAGCATPWRMTSQRCFLCPVRSTALCASLDDTELDLLSAIGKLRTVPAGQVILWAGDPNSSCATVMRGAFKMTASTPEGREQIVELAHPGDLVGQVFADEVGLTVTAVADSELCLYPRAAFERVLDASPRMERRLLERTLTALDGSRERMLDLSRRSARERVAGFIHALAERDLDEERGALTLPVGRGEMADLLGLSIETVSRQLARLRSDGVLDIEKCGRSCAVLDHPRLAAIAGIS